MLFDSTAQVVLEDDEQTDSNLPVIVPRQENSADVGEVDSDTSDSPANKLDVRPRRKTNGSLELKRDRFEVLENWEGVVTSVEGRSFFASARRTNSKIDRAEDEFEIDISNVARGDRELIRDGAVFYLTIGIRHPPGEGPQKTTRIVFRRMPRWSSRDIARAETIASELWEKLNSQTVPETTKAQTEASQFGKGDG